MGSTKALVVDFGNVLCTWTPPRELSIPPKKLKQIMSSDIWLDYERGIYKSEDECYLAVATRFGVSPSDLSSVMKKARESLQPNTATLNHLSHLKKTQPGLRIYGLTNTPLPEQSSVRSIAQEWPIFDHIYISGILGMRKPDIGCYRLVLRKIGLPAESVVFIDDSPENILAAQSLGVHSILFQSHDQLSRQLGNVLGDPIQRGHNFLLSNAKQMNSTTDKGVIIRDNFAQLLIIELTQNPDLVALETWDRTWNFFIGPPQLTTESFPNDLDTTSIALSVLPVDKEVVWSVMDEMLTFTNADGIFMTYFDRSRPRVDPVVCTNVLNLFCMHGRESEVAATFDWVLDVLRNSAYLSGSRYYSSPDCFLYFLSRLSCVVRDGTRRRELKSLLKQQVSQRIGADGDSVSLATRLLASNILGITNGRDRSRLLALQETDGGWPAGWVYKFGSSGVQIGNRGLSTALALKSIERQKGPVEAISSEPEAWWPSLRLDRLLNVWPFIDWKGYSPS
ncbi:hypothetical protein ASPVEDRAFT_66786 [Aspergillus versicolor CBS 583.65]|uniref:HAD-like protein n=1 Tax=Aspergillus versicolor CBS 583.65 TaxID=1036611 RepID=A0A1L9P2P3_ASPVE|nr:uncharacterized protein ASPVEDRAFT_66786 [Aspergillus versicolor CBS 583.65]OJI95797.1 hypothetical protein ASPVEDRAFT_66786 [Aspergillus versicolor CBS 583.65]